MNTEQLHTLLGSLSGHLVTRVAREEKEIENLNKVLSRSLLPADLQDLKSTSFAFEGADLFSLDKVPALRRDALRSVADRKVQEDAEPEFRAFVREVPVRSTQLHASVPLWAGGASVERTIGPFTRKDGRQFWFDFFRIEKLVALYVQNKPNPALLFKVSSGLQFISRILPLITQPSTSYRLPAGSIWISSEILASNAPAGYYTGLTIKGGVVTLSAAPQTINGKLTAASNTVITVRLELQQPGVTGADASSPYGIDAREASLQLPETVSFHFSAAGRTLDEISGARWDVLGHRASFEWNRTGNPVFDSLTNRVLIPFNCSERSFEVRSCLSPFHTVRGSASIRKSAWALPAAPIDIVHPTAAAGIGAMLVGCGSGLTGAWKGLRDGELNFIQPLVMAEPGRISISDPTANNSFGQQTLKLWKDDLNRFGTTVDLHYSPATPFFYFTAADGNEVLSILSNADVKIDRPVTVAGEALAIHSKNSLLILTANKAIRLVYLFDDNIFIDSIDQTKKPPSFPKPIALALRNALFKVTPVNGCVLFGSLADDFVKVTNGFLYLTFGMYAYIPTLPDPYAANLGVLRGQFSQQRLTDTLSVPTIWMWLTCQVIWAPTNVPLEDPHDKVEVSFHFAPLQNQFQSTAATPVSSSSGAAGAVTTPLAHPLVSLSTLPADVAVSAGPIAGQAAAAASVELDGEVEEGELDLDKSLPLPNYDEIWKQSTGWLQEDAFSLLDVSTNADLLGISFGTFSNRRLMLIRTHNVAPAAAQSVAGFPLQVKGLDVVSQGLNVRAFTVPPISWEPVFNLTKPAVKGDPSAGFNYYPDDGGPARIINSSAEEVALAPIPLTDFLVDSYAKQDEFFALALFTLPFGLRSLALLKKKFTKNNVTQEGTNLLLDPKTFENNLKGGRQLEMDAGESPIVGESNMFVGCTSQINNVVEMDGIPRGNSTLGRSVTRIFNREFSPKTPGDITRPRGVPLTRMDLSGYGASIFSNWLNPKATIAATSQAKFDVFLGRCAHEIIQVKSIMYPWAIRVVRTITLLRTSTNYVYRHDSGWKAESHGKFDFSYYANVPMGGKLVPVPRESPYEIHPGVVLGLFNAKEIKETRDIKPFAGPLNLPPGSTYVDEDLGQEYTLPVAVNVPTEYELQPVYFNADVEVENPVSGYVTKQIDGQEKKLIPSKRILGFVQLAPRGMPIPLDVFKALIASQQGSIGGPIDAVVNIGNSGQEMRLNRFDINNSFASTGNKPLFVAAARGNVILPKDGSWSLVKHEHGTGDVSPVPQDLSVPLIRIGKLVKPKPLVITKTMDLLTLKNVIKLDGDLVVETPPPGGQLLRIANPTEILRPPAADTINYGFLHSTDTQKALFLTPSFGLGIKKLLSKTPPLFADAFRLVNSKAVFPNIKEVGSKKYGEAIALVKDMAGFDQFTTSALADGGTKALELMDINKLAEQGYKFAKKVADFPLPDHWDLINVSNAFRIYIEYKASDESGGKGKLNFDVDSFAVDVADKWKSRMANVALVVDLGPIDRLMTIKGNWDAKKGSEASFGGGSGVGEVPSPQIKFSDKLQPIMDILEILQSLSGGNYADAVGKGVKLAMSNKAGAWEYKFEASKEIPVLRFPPGLLYNDPNQPLKLEAGLKLSAYFNSALMVTNDAKQLLPSAGGSLGFYGRLSVMCVSLSVATVYAVGQANLDFGADSKTGPFLKMKFGFGAQIVVGLPVIANVSVLYMVGVEIYLDSQKLRVSAFLLFQGHADVLGGLVSVTITIEAKGTVERNDAEDRTDLAAQVTFALEIEVFWIIDITIEESWEESRQIA
jgi:hypothetical protein